MLVLQTGTEVMSLCPVNVTTLRDDIFQSPRPDIRFRGTRLNTRVLTVFQNTKKNPGSEWIEGKEVGLGSVRLFVFFVCRLVFPGGLHRLYFRTISRRD